MSGRSAAAAPVADSVSAHDHDLGAFAAAEQLRQRAHEGMESAVRLKIARPVALEHLRRDIALARAGRYRGAASRRTRCDARGSHASRPTLEKHHFFTHP
jgi:hypothetical protein